MLTKEQIESMHTLLVRERPMGTSVAAVDELCRLALLGLERDNDRERVRKDFAEELVASMESNIRNGEAVVAMGIDSNDQSLMREGRLRELAAMFVREMVLACRFKDKLGLERDERQAVTSEQAAKDIKILEQIHAKSWDEAVALRHAAEALSERDERAERIGRAVLACMDEEQLRANDLRKFDLFDDTDGYPIDVPRYDVSGLLAVIADAMEATDE